MLELLVLLSVAGAYGELTWLVSVVSCPEEKLGRLS